MRRTWTDERLNDLSTRMDAGFERVDREIASLRGRMDKFGFGIIAAIVISTFLHGV